MSWILNRIELDDLAWQPEKRPTRSGVISTGSVLSSPYHFELRSLLSCRALMDEWHDLVQRTLEPNVFAEPELLLAGAQHLPALHAPAALLVRSARDPNGKLLALIPLEGARSPALPAASRGYLTPYHLAGVPLIDRTQAVPILRAVFDWMAGHGHSFGSSGLIWPRIPLDGAFARAVTEAAQSGNRQLDVLARGERAVLYPAGPSSPLFPHDLSAKSRKDMERYRRRLSDIGELRFVEASSGAELRDAIEGFMVLESSGWKGERNNAMVQSTRVSCFIRAASRMMGANGKCRVLSLYAGDVPIASTIILETADRSWFYKIAHDVAYAKMSPGALLTVEFSRRQQARGDITVTDSCDDYQSPMLTPLWRDTVPYGDLMVSLMPGGGPGALAMRMREKMRRKVREVAKQVYHRAMRGGR